MDCENCDGSGYEPAYRGMKLIGKNPCLCCHPLYRYSIMIIGNTSVYKTLVDGIHYSAESGIDWDKVYRQMRSNIEPTW